MAEDFNARRRRRSSHSGRRSSIGRSGLVTAGILVGLLVCFGLYWMAHRRGQFHKLRTREIPPTPAVPMPGGQEPIVLSRLSLLNNLAPEFVSATLLPGVNMQFLQIVASAPGQESYSLLRGPSVEQAAAVNPADVQVAPMHLLVGRSAFNPAAATSATDVITSLPTSVVETATLPDGGQVSAKFPAKTGPNGDVSASMLTVLNGHMIDLTVVARNEGIEDRYLTFDWAPRLAYVADGNGRTMLSVPSTQVWHSAARRNLPGTSAQDADFSGPNGRELGQRAVDTTFVALRSEFLADGPAVRLFDKQNGTILRITAFNPGVRSLSVVTDPVSHTLRLGFSSFDPSAARHEQEEALHPGQSAQWHLRLEVLPLSQPDGTGGAAAPYHSE